MYGFERYREAAHQGGKRFGRLDKLEARTLEYIGEHGAINDLKTRTITVKILYEDRVKATESLISAIDKRVNGFVKFNGCDSVVYSFKDS